MNLRKMSFGLVIAFSVLVLCENAWSQEAYPKEKIQTATDIAISIAENCSKGEFEASVKGFDATMSRVMPASRMKQTWEAVERQAGKFGGSKKTRTDRVAKYLRVFVPCKFEKSPLDMIVVFNPKLEVAGLSFQPAAKTDKNGQVTYKLPSYVNTESYTDQEVTFGIEGWKLPGNLAIPKGDGPFPAVIIVHGSGPQNRDGKIGPNKIYKDIALGLASKGIATLRYDKRTLFHKKKVIADKSLTINEETIDDALAAVDFLAKNKRIDSKRIVVLGHSLGGYAIPRMAERDKDGKIGGFIIMAGCTRPIQELIVQQMKYLHGLGGKISEEGQKTIDKVSKQAERIGSKKELLAMKEDEYLMGANKSYWLDLLDYRPAEMAKASLKVPTFILQGGRDYQVTVDEDFKQWNDALKGKSNVSFKKYRSLNHLMMVGKGKPNPQEYQLPGNVSRQVVKHIVKFVLELKK